MESLYFVTRLNAFFSNNRKSDDTMHQPSLTVLLFGGEKSRHEAIIKLVHLDGI